jgi:hypothetical protein
MWKLSNPAYANLKYGSKGIFQNFERVQISVLERYQHQLRRIDAELVHQNVWEEKVWDEVHDLLHKYSEFSAGA